MENQFEKLPEAMLNEIISHLDIISCANFSKTNKANHKKMRSGSTFSFYRINHEFTIVDEKKMFLIQKKRDQKFAKDTSFFFSPILNSLYKDNKDEFFNSMENDKRTMKELQSEATKKRNWKIKNLNLSLNSSIFYAGCIFLCCLFNAKECLGSMLKEAKKPNFFKLAMKTLLFETKVEYVNNSGIEIENSKEGKGYSFYSIFNEILDYFFSNISDKEICEIFEEFDDFYEMLDVTVYRQNPSGNMGSWLNRLREFYLQEYELTNSDKEIFDRYLNNTADVQVTKHATPGI